MDWSVNMLKTTRLEFSRLLSVSSDLFSWRPSLVVTKGIATRNKKLLVAPGITTRNKKLVGWRPLLGPFLFSFFSFSCIASLCFWSCSWRTWGTGRNMQYGHAVANPSLVASLLLVAMRAPSSVLVPSPLKLHSNSSWKQTPNLWSQSKSKDHFETWVPWQRYSLNCGPELSPHDFQRPERQTVHRRHYLAPSKKATQPNDTQWPKRS